MSVWALSSGHPREDSRAKHYLHKDKANVCIAHIQLFKGFFSIFFFLQKHIKVLECTLKRGEGENPLKSQKECCC